MKRGLARIIQGMGTYSRMYLFKTVLLLGAVTGCFSESTCNPDLDCSSAQVLDNVPDPTSCLRYYVCVDVEGSIVASDSPFDCPASEYFDPVTGSCIPLEDPICFNSCANYCSTICDSTTEESKVAVSGYKDRYNLCVGGTTIETMCPDEQPYFNGADCTDDSSQSCDFCYPYCSKPGIQVIDPDSCSSFYICDDLGGPNWDWHARCPETAWSFSAVSGKCIDSVTSCKVPCVNRTASTTTNMLEGQINLH